MKSKSWKYILIVIGILIILEVFLFSLNKTFPGEKAQEKSFLDNKNFSGVIMKLPAVDSEGKGVSTILEVEAKPGTGRTLTDIDNLLFWADTQQSIRMAKLFASRYLNSSLKDIDLIYNIKANASVIGGPSAGAALAIATIFALNNWSLNPQVTISGSINHDGSIGPVSSVLEKAKAAKKANARILLVPLLQSREIVYETKEHCEKFGSGEICQEESIPRKINITEESGVQVIEVGNIEEALRWFKLN